MKKSLIIIAAVLVAAAVVSCANKRAAVKDNIQWAVLDTVTAGRPADVFFIAPTVYFGSAEAPMMSLDDEETKVKFVGATRMEQGIYDDSCRFFAPFYRMASLWAYTQSAAVNDSLHAIAYKDVREAFETYLQLYNNQRPSVIAGFSQGAQHGIQLLKDFGETLQDRLVVCYAIGWRLTKDDVAQCPWLKPAKGETDLGCVVAISTEAPEITNSAIVPEGTWTYSINPLSWTSTTEYAPKELNHGACFTDYTGAITKEINQLTGAYIDSLRGTLKVPDVSPKDYPPGIDMLFKPGEYHVYDYQFFYRNLEENVQKRVGAFRSPHLK